MELRSFIKIPGEIITPDYDCKQPDDTFVDMNPKPIIGLSLNSLKDPNFKRKFDQNHLKKVLE